VSTVLGLDAVSAGYGRVEAITDVSIQVRRGELVVLAGPNGAGKSTTMCVAAGMLRPRKGDVTINGHRLSFRSNHDAARLGLGFVPERRELFPTLTVGEHLRLAGHTRKASQSTAFPELERLTARRAGLLSGGEQQMLAIARALALEPSVLVIDEMSLGLAPTLVSRMLERLRHLADDGMAVLLVEQHARAALAVADRAYVLSEGRVVAAGPPGELDNTELLTASYLGEAPSAPPERMTR
jgi:ABC-type branched-subunit amino acid transport system ATPase component